jgi:hypothetical protein
VRISTVLMIVGALALIFGVTVIGFGIPVQEFSFGNTLIMAGATVATGGLIVIALGAVTGQLQHLNDALAHPQVAAQPHEQFEPIAAGPAPSAAAEPQPFEPRGPASPPPFPMPAEPAPMLRNPEEPVEVEDDVSLSPQQPAPEAPAQDERARGLPAWMRPRQEPAKDRPSIFDSMWPPENKMFGRAGADVKTEPAPSEEPPAPEPTAVEEAAPAMATPAEAPSAEEQPKPRAVAILKSGVVDGMSYTLYVDGSIEAELPQGTLRFASIHELRAHLEQNG